MNEFRQKKTINLIYYRLIRLFQSIAFPEEWLTTVVTYYLKLNLVLWGLNHSLNNINANTSACFIGWIIFISVHAANYWPSMKLLYHVLSVIFTYKYLHAVPLTISYQQFLFLIGCYSIVPIWHFIKKEIKRINAQILLLKAMRKMPKKNMKT